MTQCFFFGMPQRTLFGALHGADAVTDTRPFLVVPPLFQEGVMSQRALWTLAESLSATGVPALRFDWYGSGDSGGTSTDMDAAGLQVDLRLARSRLGAASAASAQCLVGLRSACLPLLAHASGEDEPVDLVLWDPVWTGATMVSAWRQQHKEQMRHAGRYLRDDMVAGDDELAGFEVAADFLRELSVMDGRNKRLAAGSRVLLAVWEDSAALQAFVAAQSGAGVHLEVMTLQAHDQPLWSDPFQFESQAFPRRSVSQLTQRLAA